MVEITPYRLTWVHLADWLLCILILFPSYVCYWRGLWDLFTYYIPPQTEPGKYWSITAIGSLTLLGYIFYPSIEKSLSKLSRTPRIILTRVTLYIYAIALMAYWRGVWGLADYYLADFQYKGCFPTLVVAVLGMVLTGCLRTTLCPPFVVCMDTRKNVLKPSTRFKRKLTKHPKDIILYILDACFTQFVQITFVILALRSLLTALRYIPFQGVNLYFYTLYIGIAASAVLLGLEIPLSRLGRYICEPPIKPGSESSVRSSGELNAACNIAATFGDLNTYDEKISDQEKNINTDVDLQHSDRNLNAKRTIGNQEKTTNADVDLQPSDRDLNAKGTIKNQEKTAYTDVDIQHSGRDLNVSGTIGSEPMVKANSKWRRFIYEDIIIMLTIGLQGFIWLGLWNVNTTYFFPDIRVGGWVNFALGSIMLLGLQVISFPGACGAAFDGVHCPHLPIYRTEYLRRYVRHRNKQKMITQTEAIPIVSANIPHNDVIFNNRLHSNNAINHGTAFGKPVTNGTPVVTSGENNPVVDRQGTDAVTHEHKEHAFDLQF